MTISMPRLLPASGLRRERTGLNSLRQLGHEFQRFRLVATADAFQALS